MQTIPIEGKKPLFSWCPSIQPDALAQAEKFARLPFVIHMAVMPDAAFGMGIPVGSVVATKGVVIPSAVGTDGGCGMIACQTSLFAEPFQDEYLRNRIHVELINRIPMGHAHNIQRRTNELKKLWQNKVDYLVDKSNIANVKFGITEVDNAIKMLFEQLGTLGGGNHFIEVQRSEQDNSIWLMVHSGSRNIGKRICDTFNKLAEEVNQKWYSVDTNGIPFLPTDSEEGKAYIAWEQFALRFAYLNRAIMLDEVKQVILNEFPNCKFEPEINIHHNYAAIENHFGQNLWVHRKGATEARETTIGIIPGSMGTPSYIVQGLGNEKSLMSCSHGAGRIIGRMDFNRRNNTPEAIAAIEKMMAGITYTKFGKERDRKGQETGRLDIAEAPTGYKDIEDVMKNQTDLVKPLHKLLPVINWKDVGEE